MASHLPKVFIRQVFQQKGHGPVVTPPISKVAQLVEKIAFRFTRDTRVVRISPRFILGAVAGSTGFYPLGYRVGSVNRGNIGGKGRRRKKQACNQNKTSHSGPFIIGSRQSVEMP